MTLCLSHCHPLVLKLSSSLSGLSKAVGGGVYNFRPECLGLSYNERNNLDSPGLGLRAEQQAPEKAVWLMK